MIGVFLYMALVCLLTYCQIGERSIIRDHFSRRSLCFLADKVLVPRLAWLRPTVRLVRRSSNCISYSTMTNVRGYSENADRTGLQKTDFDAARSSVPAGRSSPAWPSRISSLRLSDTSAILPEWCSVAAVASRHTAAGALFTCSRIDLSFRRS